MKKWVVLTVSLSLLSATLSFGGDTAEINYNHSLFSSPTAHAIETRLLATTNFPLLSHARSIEGGTYDNQFGRFDLLIGKDMAQKKVRFYLFKEDGKWAAYETLPTQKDNLYVFVELATDYLTQKRGVWTGASVVDDTWKTKDTNQRVINFVYDEGGKGAPIALTFTFTKQQGWQISSANKQIQPITPPVAPSPPPASAPAP